MDKNEPIQMELNLDWDELLGNDVIKRQGDKIKVDDALILSITQFGGVDLNFICEKTGCDYLSVTEKLKGSIFQNPLTWNEDPYQGWETADEYLSGNLMQKYTIAKENNAKYGGLFKENIRAIKKVMPKNVSLDEVYVKLGTPWIPESIIEEFINQLIDCRKRGYLVHDEQIGSWEIKCKDYIIQSSSRTRAYLSYGTNRISALKIIEKILNNQTIAICDEVADSTTKSGKRKVLNKKETLLALEKSGKIKGEFRSWVRNDLSRVKKLEKVYQEKFGCIRRRFFDGSFLTFPNMNEEIKLYPYQKNAVARILFSPNTLLAHEVGAGKTYIMVASGMELKRMGVSKKNLYVVPNNIIGQWKEAFSVLYPNSNVYVISPKDFTPSKRQKVLENVKDNDYDAIIMAYSSFEMIPLSFNYCYNQLVDKLHKDMERLRRTINSTETFRRRVERLKEKINNLVLNPQKDQGIYFDQLNVNTLFVDEAHNFKNVPFDTNAVNVLGLNPAGSIKCKNFFEKVKCVQNQNNGRGVVFATGTPITNSLSDIFIMQTYLQRGTLEMLDLSSFDAWINNFADLGSGFEIDVDTNNYRIVKRFTKFNNLQDLTSMLSLFADFYQTRNGNDIPKLDGYTDVLVEKTQDLSNYLAEISKRADDVRSKVVARTEDNMLKITTDGRKAALDIRLVNDKANFSFDSKVYRCAENVFRIYNASKDVLGTQLVFCDTSTPKDAVNMYDELKRLLIFMGVTENEIQFIHNAKTEAQREATFKAVRQAKIRVLIGSTWKLGLGVNVQDHLIALHHLDVPWRPADMVQREGRILRQGNLNEKVEIYRYITEGSFDAYSWQLLETKQRFINDLLAGSIDEKSSADVGDTVLKYAEVKALAIGNPLIKERVERTNELTKFIALKKNYDETKERLSAEKESLPNVIAQKKSELKSCQNDVDFLSANKKEYSLEEKREFGKLLISEIKDGELQKEEKFLFEYNGFKIVRPAKMLAIAPYVLVQNDLEYKLDMSFSEIGVITRLDNFFEGFEKIKTEKSLALERFKDRLKVISKELEKPDEYSDKIEELTEKIKELDKQLGVTK